HGVAAIPPSVFYDHKKHGRSYARFAFCKKDETLETAVARLERLCA
ncbi:MAG: aminotransferase, partial [Acidobacteriota bacterium]|nr:aminotransferase [Acidobacteriota bacterium]